MATELPPGTEVSIKPVTPSAVYNNLSFCGNIVVYAHQQDCVVLRASGPHKLPIPEAFKAPVQFCSATVVRGTVVVLLMSANRVHLWDVARDVSLCVIPSDAGIEPRGGALLEQGDRLFGAFGFSEGSVLVYEFTADYTPNLVGRSNGHVSPVSSIAASAEGGVMFVSGCTGGALQLWNTTLQPYTTIPAIATTECVTSVAICGPTFIAAAYGSGKVRLFIATGEMRVELQATARWINAMCFNRHRMLLAVAGDDGRVSVWTVPTTESPKVALVGYRQAKNLLYTGVAFSADGSSVMTAAFDHDKISTIPIPQLA